jgi:hypothetical protein
LAEVMDDVLKVAQRAGETIDPSNHQGVAFAEKLKQRCQLFAPLGAGAGYLLRSRVVKTTARTAETCREMSPTSCP